MTASRSPQRRLESDLRHVMGCWDAGRLRVFVSALLRSRTHPAVKAVVLTRLSMVLWSRGHRFAALWCKSRAVARTGSEIHPAATIGPGMNLVHTVGIVVGHEVVAGRDLVLHHNVTLGHGSKPGQPVLGDRVWVGAGAVILGGVRIGDGAVIGANAVVLADVAAGQTAHGVWK